MGIALSKARFSGTIASISEARHPATKRPIHVLAYQNVPVNESEGGNAMLLHFPTRFMGPENVVSTEYCGGFLKDMVRACTYSSPAMTAYAPRIPQGIQLFHRDTYTVIMAERASAIPEALALVPPERRPRWNPGLYAWCDWTFFGYTYALLCFNAREGEGRSSRPLLFWYEPIDPDTLMVPGIRSQSGGIPESNDLVETDHWVFVGSRERFSGSVQVKYTQAVNAGADPLLPQYVSGLYSTSRLKNADFLFRRRSNGFELTQGILKVR